MSSTYHPPFDEFAQLSQGVRMVPVYRQLLSDTHTPVSVYAGCLQGARPFLFESVVGGEKIGRYSFLGSNPYLTIEAQGKTVTITTGDKQETRECQDPLVELQKLIQEYPAVHLKELPRFCGGAVGYAGYDVVRYTENLPNAPQDDRKLPDLSFSFYDEMIIFDQINKTIQVVVHADLSTQKTEAAYQSACQRLDEICARLQQHSPHLSALDINTRSNATLEYTSDHTQAEYEANVEKCKEYIKAGDIFQVVISQRLCVETEADSLSIYRALRVVNPSPFMFLMSLPELELVGSSPEIMVRVEDGETTVRPLAGTRKRGQSPEEDKALAEELLADPKERAEHIMLVDLARNDIGRVAQFGSVRINDIMVVEKYSHVMHITSNVCGQLRPEMTALDALRAALPAGTVSGAPKVRAMQVIDEMERHRRGPYAGAVGYIDFTGNMDTCIALRTLVLHENKAYIQAGAGIVADSVPTMEYQETLNKARVLIKALTIAQNQLHAQ
jgi:anthranilate synthase component 1